MISRNDMENNEKVPWAGFSFLPNRHNPRLTLWRPTHGTFCPVFFPQIPLFEYTSPGEPGTL